LNPSDTPIETVIDLYLSACDELFSTYSLTKRLKRADSDRGKRRGSSYVSVLGATSETIRFSSTVSIDAGLLKTLHPAPGGKVSQRDLEDWCRELNNQLVGRVKNKLLRYGCEVSAGLPVLITGNDIDTLGTPGQDLRRYYFATEHGRLALTLAMVPAPDFELKEVAASPDGEVVRLEGVHDLF
jgi:hypothetical protein